MPGCGLGAGRRRSASGKATISGRIGSLTPVSCLHPCLTLAVVTGMHRAESRPPRACAIARFVLRGHIAAARTVEDHPHGEVLCKILETMLDSRGHEEKIAWPESVSLAVVEEDAAATDDDVNFVLRVGSRRPR